MEKIKQWLLNLSAVALLATASINAQAVMLSFDGPTSVNEGDSFTMDLVASGFETEDLSAFDIDVLFDNTLLDFTGYTLGTELTDLFIGQVDLSFGESVGKVNLAEVSGLLDFTAQPDSFVIGSLTFDALQAGIASFSFDYVELTDGDLFSPSTILNVDSSNTLDVAVAEVPAPASALLFALGLVMVGAQRYKKRV